jgi:FKBP-type peptidyl-prolyl cis-trans isomerase FklB
LHSDIIGQFLQKNILMKKVFISTVILLITVISVSAQTGSKTAAKPAAQTAAKPKPPVMKNLMDSFSYAAGINVATNMKAQGINKLNIPLMLRALNDIYNNATPALTTEVANTCLQKQMQVFSVEQSAAEKTKGLTFLANNKKRKEVTTLPDGLQYEVISSGDVNGVHPKPVDTVVVNYIGTSVDGIEFDNSYKRGQPAAFPLMGVIKGWVEILQLMKPGDHWKVYIPTELGYDSAGYGNSIPPNAALVFDMTLVEIRPAVETPKTGQ